VRSALAQLLFPAECLVCHALLPFARAQDVVCPVCRSRWRPLVPPWCERCGQPAPLVGPCRLCRDWPRTLCCVRSAVWLDGSARRAVHGFKYEGLPRIATQLAAALARVRLPSAGPALLVPVPLGAGRRRARGYNQSERLARALGPHWGWPVADMLIRTRETAPQATLTPVARLANVAGAFAVRNAACGTRPGAGPGRAALPGLRPTLILVDDVFTTGATLAAAARALEAGGARRVMAVTFGRAVIPDFT
jgi:predicted amidophosphoribosyltransferase